MFTFEIISYFVLGITIGSFLCLVADRLPKGITVTTGRSSCDSCGAILRPSDLVPLLSYSLSKGRCRSCGVKLSPRYLIVELLTGITYVLVYLSFGITITGVIWLAITSILIVLSLIDFDTMTINNRFQVMLFLIGVVLIILNPSTIWSSLIGSLLITSFYFILWFFNGLGFADVKLAFVGGLILGWKLSILSFFISSVLGGIYAAIQMIKGVAKDAAIPYGPFMACGIFISGLYGTLLIEKYLLLFAWLKIKSI